MRDWDSATSIASYFVFNTFNQSSFYKGSATYFSREVRYLLDLEIIKGLHSEIIRC